MNSQLVGRLSQEEQLTSCSICLETVPKAKETRLNDCPHTYCFDCIKKWVKEVENTCPQCKKPISQLKRADGEGVLTIEAVSHRRQNEIIGSCLVCEQSLNIADVIIRRHRGNENRVRDNQNISTVCEVCLTFAIHVRCMHGWDQDVWQALGIWQCPGCIHFQAHFGAHNIFGSQSLRGPRARPVQAPAAATTQTRDAATTTSRQSRGTMSSMSRQQQEVEQL